MGLIVRTTLELSTFLIRVNFIQLSLIYLFVILASVPYTGMPFVINSSSYTSYIINNNGLDSWRITTFSPCFIISYNYVKI